MCMGILPTRCVCTTCMLGAHKSQKKALDPLELEFQTVESGRVGAGTEPGASARAARGLNS